MVEYTEMLMLRSVQCYGCKQIYSPPSPLVAGSEPQLHQMAEALHRAARIVCANPQFVIEYANCLVDNRLQPPTAEVVQDLGPRQN